MTVGFWTHGLLLSQDVCPLSSFPTCCYVLSQTPESLSPHSALAMITDRSNPHFYNVYNWRSFSSVLKDFEWYLQLKPCKRNKNHIYIQWIFSGGNKCIWVTKGDCWNWHILHIKRNVLSNALEKHIKMHSHTSFNFHCLESRLQGNYFLPQLFPSYMFLLLLL